MKKELQIDRLAELSKLYLTSSEKEDLERGMDALLSFAEVLEELEEANNKKDTTAASINKLKNVMREDECSICFDREEMLKNAPLRDEQYVIVPKVVE